MNGVEVEGDVEIGDGRIVGVGLHPKGRKGLAVPGFIDLQVNAWSDIDLGDTDIHGYRSVARHLACTGTTTWLPTLPTMEPGRLETAVGVAAQYVASPAPPGATAVGASAPGASAPGLHLEGPFLNEDRRGAHPAEYLRAPDPDLLTSWLDVAPIRMVTLAPELPGATALLDRLVDRDVLVSIGHSNATAEQSHFAFDRGARVHTHVWNAHRPITSRDPGSGAVALRRADVHPCLIADLAHVHADTLAMSLAAASDRYVLVSDAGLGAGLPPGRHLIPQGPRGQTIAIDVVDGACRLSDGSLIGSATSLHGCVLNVIGLGRPLHEALDAVTRRPAALLGLSDRGRLLVGERADLVVLDGSRQVTTVLVEGEAIDPGGSREGTKLSQPLDS